MTSELCRPGPGHRGISTALASDVHQELEEEWCSEDLEDREIAPAWCRRLFAGAFGTV